MFANSSVSNATTDCQDGWSYTTRPGEVSIVTEWDLVCGQDYMSDLSQTIYQGAGLFGNIFGSILVDKYGRKRIFVIGTFLCGLGGAAIAFSPNYLLFCILKALTAVVVMGQCWSSETMMMEMFDSKRRAFAGIGLEALWVLDYVMLGVLAYYLRNWRHLQLVMSLLILPAMVAIWILPESPMWLVANGRMEEAETILQDIARYNGVKAPARLLPVSRDPDGELLQSGTVNNNQTDDAVKAVEESADTEKQGAVELPLYSWTKLFTDRTMLRCSIISSLLWFANGMVYYAMILQSPSMPGNIYLTFILGAIIEIPAYILTYFIIIRWGRRIPTFASHLLAGILLILVTFVPQTTESGADLSILIIILTLSGKFAITVSFGIVILYMKEIFPTNLRASSGGICDVPARIGTMLAPFAAYTAKRVSWLPNAILSVVCIVAAVVTLLLPETMGTPLPHTIEEVKDLFQGHKMCSVRVRRTGSERTKEPVEVPLSTELLRREGGEG